MTIVNYLLYNKFNIVTGIIFIGGFYYLYKKLVSIEHKLQNLDLYVKSIQNQINNGILVDTSLNYPLRYRVHPDSDLASDGSCELNSDFQAPDFDPKEVKTNDEAHEGSKSSDDE